VETDSIERKLEMNQAEKIRLYKSQDYYDMVEMQIFAWLRYWVEANPDTIIDPDPERQEKLRADTKKVMDMILVNPDRIVKKVMILAINHSKIDEIAALTVPDLKIIIDSVMGQNLTYIIGDGSPW
jgi:hypothetical protein